VVQTTPSKQLLSAAFDVDILKVQRALADKADPNVREEREGQTPLHLCIRGFKGPPQRVAFGTVRPYREVENIVTIVNLLLRVGADVNAADNDGVTAIHWASGYGFVRIIQILIKAGANVHVTDKYGITPLHQAAISGAKEAAEVLISAGADVNKRTKDGLTALAIAESNKILGGGVDMMEPFRQMLRRHGATL